MITILVNVCHKLGFVVASMLDLHREGKLM